jgi:hypothetical protein
VAAEKDLVYYRENCPDPVPLIGILWIKSRWHLPCTF